MNKEPAFPQTERVYDAEKKEHLTATGMTLRDWFAGQALCGMLPARDEHGRSAYTEMLPGEIAAGAYEIADATLKAREETK